MSTAFPQLTKTWHLDQLKDKVEELQDMDLGAYTDDSVTQLKDALSKAEALIQREDSTKAQLKEAYGQLDEAEQGLVLKSDKRALASKRQNSCPSRSIQRRAGPSCRMHCVRQKP